MTIKHFFTKASRIPFFYFCVTLLFTSLLYTVAAENDSLRYESILSGISKSAQNGKRYQSEIQTAHTLAEAGLFGEAVEVLEKFIIQDTEASETPLPKKKTTTARWVVFSDYNDNRDIDYSTKTSVQKDSMARVKNFIIGNGLLLNHDINKPYLSAIRNDIYLSNLVSMWQFSLIGSYFDSLLTIENEFWMEKVFSKKYDNTWKYLATTADSTDLIGNTLKMEFAFSNPEKTLMLTIPGKFSWTHYRQNTLYYRSKNNLSINPFFEFSPRSGKMIFSTNFYTEYFNYYGDTLMLRDTAGLFTVLFPLKDTLPMYIPVNSFDMIVTQPEFSFSLFLNKLTIELLGHINREYFFNIGNPVSREWVPDPNDEFRYSKILVDEVGNARTSTQREIETKFSFRLFSWLTARVKSKYLHGENRYDFTDIDSFVVDETTNLKAKFTPRYSIWGNDLIVNPFVEFKLPRSLKITAGVAWNQRYGPIYNNINMDTLFLWETFDAWEPELSVTLNRKKIYLKISESYRYEDIKEHRAYLKVAGNGAEFLSSSHNWITKWDFTFQFSDRLYAYLMGRWEPKWYVSKPYIPDDVELYQHNLNFNLGMQMSF